MIHGVEQGDKVLPEMKKKCVQEIQKGAVLEPSELTTQAILLGSSSTKVTQRLFRKVGSRITQLYKKKLLLAKFRGSTALRAFWKEKKNNNNKVGGQILYIYVIFFI